jgi:hemoglobin/transferrin/lactoferrin receptor protein
MNLSDKLLVSLVFSAITGLLVAQETDSLPGLNSLSSQTLGEVVISANRYGSVILKTPEAINPIDNKTIQKFQPNNAPSALKLTPGVFVQKTNHGGGSPFLRGLTGNQTLLLVDGIRLSNATTRYGPNQYFNTIDVFSIEKIEVLRGSGSVQYGSDAIGGTIQTFSHDPVMAEKPTWGSDFLTRIATQGMEQSLHGAVKYSNKKVAFRAGVAWRNFGHLVGGDTTGRQIPTGYKEIDFDLKGKILLSPLSILTMAFQSVNQSDVPVYHKVVLENYAVNKMDHQKRNLAYLNFNHKVKAGILKSVSLKASFQYSEESRELRKNGSSVLRTEKDKVYSSTFSAEAFTKKGYAWSANSGLEVYNDKVKSMRTDSDLSNNETDSKRGLYPNGADMTSMAAFSLHTFDLQDWNFTAGVRFNTFVINVTDEAVGNTTLTPSAFVGNLGLLRKLNKTSNLFVSMNTGFRAPNIDDLGTLGIVDFRYETPNFDLKPEHSFQYQLGYKYQDRKIKGEVYIYRNELYNLIVRNKVPGDSIDGYPVYQKENVERAYVQGVETAWEFALNQSWLLSGNLTYTYGQNITKDEPVRRIPPLFGRLALEYGHKNWWFNLEWLAAGKQERLAQGDKDDNRIPSGGTPGWNIFNINGNYTLRFIKFDVNLVNLFNSDYRYHGSGVNGCGRSAFLSVTINI